MADVVLPGGIRVPDADFEVRVSRSSGPGGQGVNTTDSQVELRFDLANTEAFSERQKDRIRRALGNRITKDGVLILTASEHRSQHRNRKEVEGRFRRLVTEALVPPTPRRRTKPSRGAKERRLKAKHERGETKRLRQPPDSS